MPRVRSISIQSDTTPRRPALPCTAPAWPITRECSASASVIVDFPASGWEITANVRRLAASCSTPAGAAATVDGCDPILLTDLLSRRCRYPPAAGRRF